MVYTCSWTAEWDGDSAERKILWFEALHRIFFSSLLSRSFVFCSPLALYTFRFRKSYTSFRYAYVNFCCKITKIKERFCKGKEKSKSALSEAVVWSHRYNQANNNWGLITSGINITFPNCVSITYCRVVRGEKELGKKQIKWLERFPINLLFYSYFPVNPLN